MRIGRKLRYVKSPIVKAFLFVMAASLLNAQQAPPPSTQGGSKSTSDENCGMVYGKAHAFSVCAPKGWVLDNTILNDQGIYAVFYPAGSSWNAAKDKGTVMYVNTAAKESGSATVSALMATDAEDTKRNAPSAVKKACEAIKLDKAPEEPPAPVQCFAPGAFERFEAVAYIDSPKIITMVVMTSKNEHSFKQDYPAFLALVKSYWFFSSDVTIQHK